MLWSGKHIWRGLRFVFNRTMDKVEDPEIMLDQARRDMQAALIGNREKAVQAITQKNRLQGMLEEATKKSVTLEQNAVMALKQENRELAQQFMREKMNNDAVSAQLQQSYEQALAANPAHPHALGGMAQAAVEAVLRQGLAPAAAPFRARRLPKAGVLARGTPARGPGPSTRPGGHRPATDVTPASG